MFTQIPFVGDDLENVTIIKFAIELMKVDAQRCMPHMEKIATTCVQIIADPKTAEALPVADKRLVGAFLKNQVVGHAQSVLQQMEAQMSDDEKEQLAKYMS